MLAALLLAMGIASDTLMRSVVDARVFVFLFCLANFIAAGGLCATAAIVPRGTVERWILIAWMQSSLTVSRYRIPFG